MVVLYKFGAAGGSLVQEVPQGNTDGVNKVFETSGDFQAGTLQVFYNGQFFREGDDYEVFNGNKFRLMYVTPYNGDVLNTIYYKG